MTALEDTPEEQKNAAIIARYPSGSGIRTLKSRMRRRRAEVDMGDKRERWRTEGVSDPMSVGTRPAKLGERPAGGRYRDEDAKRER